MKMITLFSSNPLLPFFTNKQTLSLERKLTKNWSKPTHKNRKNQRNSQRKLPKQKNTKNNIKKIMCLVYILYQIMNLYYEIWEKNSELTQKQRSRKVVPLTGFDRLRKGWDFTDKVFSSSTSKPCPLSLLLSDLLLLFLGTIDCVTYCLLWNLTKNQKNNLK